MPLPNLSPLKTQNVMEPPLTQNSPASVASNKTELSAKVEAELFEEYDAMVPGPAAAGTLGNNAPGGGGGQERTGRPLKINLDLLSYQAKQRHIKVRQCAGGVTLALYDAKRI